MIPNREAALRAFMAPLALTGLKGIEIGPYDRPFLPKADYPQVEYADVFSTDELRKHASLNPKRNPDAVVPVDHVLRDQRLADVVPRGSMDFVFCSHVLEHVPDLIAELQGIERLLKPGGLLVCAYPDRRYTFDIDRAATSLDELTNRHGRGIRKPDPATVYDYFIKYRQVFVGRIWEGLPNTRGPVAYTAQIAAQKAKSAETTYIDVHTNLFSDAEFSAVIAGLHQAQLLSLQMDQFSPTRRPFNEFFFTLRKNT